MFLHRFHNQSGQIQWFPFFLLQHQVNTGITTTPHPPSESYQTESNGKVGRGIKKIKLKKIKKKGKMKSKKNKKQKQNKTKQQYMKFEEKKFRIVHFFTMQHLQVSSEIASHAIWPFMEKLQKKTRVISLTTCLRAYKPRQRRPLNIIVILTALYSSTVCLKMRKSEKEASKSRISSPTSFLRDLKKQQQ